MAPQICPDCGAVVPPNSKACPGCGSDDQTGWSEEAYAADPDLPEENFDYQDFVEREFGEKPVGATKVVPPGIHWLWWVTAIVVLGTFILLYVL
jgi:hypothetical protein